MKFKIDTDKEKSEKLKTLLNEVYVFLGMGFKELSPWGAAIEDWLGRVEKETLWHHFEELRKFEEARLKRLDLRAKKKKKFKTKTQETDELDRELHA